MIIDCGIKIILIGYPSDQDKIKALEKGASYYLTKPIKAEELIEVIESILKKERRT